MKGKCFVPNCNRPLLAKGMCKGHYYHRARHCPGSSQEEFVRFLEDKQKRKEALEQGVAKDELDHLERARVMGALQLATMSLSARLRLRKEIGGLFSQQQKSQGREVKP
jgi:hypothetical protein